MPSEKMELTVVSVSERKSVGEKGAVKLDFKAKVKDKEGKEKELPFFTFSKRLFETVEGAVGKTLSCDVDISTREYGGNQYTDRKVVQVYIDGQPVSIKQGWGHQEDSPEKILSIEAQTAYNGAIELMKAKVITPPESSVLCANAIEWGIDRLLKSLKAPYRLELAEPKAVKVPAEVKSTAELKQEIFGEPPGLVPGGFTTEDLFSRIAEAKAWKSTKTCRSWLVNSLKIEESRIGSDPAGVWAEIKAHLA